MQISCQYEINPDQSAVTLNLFCENKKRAAPSERTSLHCDGISLFTCNAPTKVQVASFILEYW